MLKTEASNERIKLAPRLYAGLPQNDERGRRELLRTARAKIELPLSKRFGASPMSEPSLYKNTRSQPDLIPNRMLFLEDEEEAQ